MADGDPQGLESVGLLSWVSWLPQRGILQSPVGGDRKRAVQDYGNPVWEERCRNYRSVWRLSRICFKGISPPHLQWAQCPRAQSFSRIPKSKASVLYSGQRCSSCRSQDRESERLLLQETDCSLLLVSSTPFCCLCLFCFGLHHSPFWIIVPPTRNWTWAQAVKALSPKRWTAREFPHLTFDRCCLPYLGLSEILQWASGGFLLGIPP